MKPAIEIPITKMSLIGRQPRAGDEGVVQQENCTVLRYSVDGSGNLVVPRSTLATFWYNEVRMLNPADLRFPAAQYIERYFA
jgi:hypothetical protein